MWFIVEGSNSGVVIIVDGSNTGVVIIVVGLVRPDGIMIIVPWSSGKLLVSASSNISLAVRKPGASSNKG